ncbi:hypothetical protein AB0K23_01430 [Streptomyces sp. NPDC049602]|uniref:DUF7739 domain-containing protein n=1 Tax=Streptomyces sp. NPDC049602 TaxID=3155504 RepID=UPI003430578A
MGWSISHGGTRYSFSYSGVAELREHIKKAAGWSQRRTLKPVTDRRSGDPFSITPRDAKAIGQALLDVASRLPSTSDDDWAGMARQIGRSALRAASANEPWVWS